MDQKEYQSLILGALLHDVGKLSQRTGGEYYAKHAEFSGNFIASLKEFFGEALCRKIAELVERHHTSPTTRNELILHIADKLAASERKREERGKLRSNEAALVAVTSRVEFRKMWPKDQNERYYKLTPLRIERDYVFPTGEQKIQDEKAYENLWDAFITKINFLKRYQPAHFNTLYFILREFGTLAPSATPWEEDEFNRTVPDVSLFDHSKVTCAIASCLAKIDEKDLTNKDMADFIEILRIHYKEKDEQKGEEILNSSSISNKNLFLLVRGDIAGIQKFIYSITRPEVETKGTAKRLRGRSFYLTILNDVIADWIVREMHLPITNILFCGGGRFDILLPNSHECQLRLNDLGTELDEWLLKEFYGELSIQMAKIEIRPKDFFNFSKIYQSAEDELSEKKMRKFEGQIISPNFFKLSESVEDVCRFCLIVPRLSNQVWKNDRCKQCNSHTEIGSKLPKAHFIAYVYGKRDFTIPKDMDAVKIPFEDFGVTVFIADNTEMKRILDTQVNQEIAVYRINPGPSRDKGLDFIVDGNKGSISYGFKFLGNSAPMAYKDCQILPYPKGPVRAKEVLDFEEIAQLATGAKYLGVLKMDVDYLGMLFGLGVDQPSISRIATLSSNFEIFFSTWLNSICEKVTKRWEESLDENSTYQGLVKSLFYIVYSGGDDLFIIGPWDQVIELALEIYKDFRDYTCENPNITLSGGLLFVKPHFPIQRFAQLVTQELEKSKKDADRDNGVGLKEKNRITLFGDTVEWREGPIAFEELLGFANTLVTEVESKESPLPKGFIYYLRELEEYMHKKNKMWPPYFFYSLVRRVKKEEVRAELQSKVPTIMGKLKIPVSYVSLKTRKE